MNYLTGVYWNRGSAAALNQDSLILQQVLTRRGRILLAAVCDGMGGLQQGETASGYMAERLQEWFYGFLMRAVNKKKPYWMIRRSIDRLVYHVQEQMLLYSRKEQIDLGTTMSVLLLWDNIYLIWHLGDSRIYYMRKGSRYCGGQSFGKNRQCGGQSFQKNKYCGKQGCEKNKHNGRWIRRKGGYGEWRKGIECMTEDHVKGRNQLTKCVGSFGYYRPDYRMGMVKEGDAFLLCSDGFRHCVTDQELADILHPQRLQEELQVERRLKEIGDACIKRGEKDNLSAVYIKLMA